MPKMNVNIIMEMHVAKFAKHDFYLKKKQVFRLAQGYLANYRDIENKLESHRTGSSKDRIEYELGYLWSVVHLDRRNSFGRCAASAAARRHRSPEASPRSLFIITVSIHHITSLSHERVYEQRTGTDIYLHCKRTM